MMYKSRIPLLILLGFTVWGIWRSARKHPKFGGFIESDELEIYE